MTVPQSHPLRAFAMLVVFAGLVVSADAQVIPQTASFKYQAHGSGATSYNQFNPALGHLDGVLVESIGNVFIPVYEFHNFTTDTITFNLTSNIIIGTDGGSQYFTSTTPETLMPGGSVVVSTQYSFDLSSFATTGLDRYIGTGTLTPFAVVNGGLSPDNPNITIQKTFPSDINSIMGTDKIAYFYSQAVPEPASVAMFAAGMLGVLGLRWWRRSG